MTRWPGAVPKLAAAIWKAMRAIAKVRASLVAGLCLMRCADMASALGVVGNKLLDLFKAVVPIQNSAAVKDIECCSRAGHECGTSPVDLFLWLPARQHHRRAEIVPVFVNSHAVPLRINNSNPRIAKVSRQHLKCPIR